MFNKPYNHKHTFQETPPPPLDYSGDWFWVGVIVNNMWSIKISHNTQ